jgi:hypothetical protein
MLCGDLRELEDCGVCPVYLQVDDVCVCVCMCGKKKIIIK